MQAQTASTTAPRTETQLDEVPLIDAIGGRDVILRVHKRFYGKVYADPWLKGFFVGANREHQENQLTDFMTSLFGGPRAYSGRLPNKAHPHLFVTDEVFDLRQKFLKDALEEIGIDPELITLWIERDELFRKVIVKKSVSECHGRYKNEPVLAPAKP